MRLEGLFNVQVPSPWKSSSVLGHPHASKDTAQVSCCISWEKSLSCQVLCSSSLIRLTELLLTLGFNTPDDGHALPERGSWHWMSLKFDLSADLTFKMPAAAGWWDSPCEGAGTGPCLGGIKVKPPPLTLAVKEMLQMLEE